MRKAAGRNAPGPLEPVKGKGSLNVEILNPQIAYSALMDFLGAGGNVLVAIMVVTFCMWALIIERLMYWSGAHAGVVKRAQRAYQGCVFGNIHVGLIL